MPPPAWDASSPSLLFRRVQRGKMVGQQDAEIDARQTHERERKQQHHCLAQLLCLYVHGQKEGQKEDIPLGECTGPLGDATRSDGAKTKTHPQAHTI